MLIGIAPLTMVRTTRGASEYVYQGAPAPSDIHPDDADRLLAEGFLDEVEDAVVPDEMVVPNDPATGSAGPGVTMPAPAKVANKQAWVDYRVGQRLLTEDLAEDVTVKQLQDDAFMASYLQQVQTAAAERQAAEAEARRATEEAAQRDAAAAQSGSTTA